MRKISDGRTLKEIDNPNAGLGSKKKQKDKSQMFSEYSASYANPQEEIDIDEIYDLMDIVEEYPLGRPVYARNFDFVLNVDNEIWTKNILNYTSNIQVKGEGTAISSSAKLQGRVVSGTAI